MSNCLFAFPDRTLNASLVSGGSWSGLERLQSDERHTVAQSADLTLDSTQYVVDLGQERDLRLIVLLDHNASLAGQVRVRVGNDPTFAETLYDSGWQPFWFTAYPQGGLMWGHPDLWDGGQVAGEDYAAFPKMRYFMLTDDYSIQARFYKVEIDDQTNPAGYFAISRSIAAPCWQPQVNMNYGAQVQWDGSATVLSTSKGGKDYYAENPMRRVCNFTLDVPEVVSSAMLLEFQRKLGISREFFFVFNPDDATMTEQQRSFLATFKTLSPIDFPYFERATNAFQIREKL